MNPAQGGFVKGFMVLVFLAAALVAVFTGLAMLVAVAGLVLRALLFLVLLPFRLLFLVIGLPLAIVGSIGVFVLAVVGGGLLLGAGILAAILTSAALPVLLVVAAVWALVRLTRRPVAA